jgi:hypothetical protein
MKEYRYSAIDTAYSCLQKYKYVYVDGDRSPDTLDMAFGTAMHLVPQCFFEKEDPVATFAMYWDSIKDKFEPNRFTWEQYKDMGEVFASRWLRLHAKYYEPMYIEKTIKTDLNGFTISGTPDFIGLYKGVPTVMDWKTASYEYNKYKLILNEQPYIYAYMASKCYGIDIKQVGYSVFVKNPEPRIQLQTNDLTQGKLKDMMDNVTLMMRDLSSRSEYPKNRNSCVMGKDYKCSFYERCYDK